MDKEYQYFSDWFCEIVEPGKSRYQVAYEDYDKYKGIRPFDNMRDWLMEAFYAGQKIARTESNLAQIPKQVFNYMGWSYDTPVEWQYLGDGQYSLKKRQL